MYARYIAFCIVLFFFILSAPVVAGYTVVLKNGSAFEATLISEDDTVIRVRDNRGLEYNLKKSSLDLSAMKRLNQQKASDKSRNTESTKKSEPKKEEKKVFTNDDIRQLRDFTEPGTVEKERTEEASQQENEKPNESKEKNPLIPSRSEKIRERIASLEKEYEQAESECERSGGHSSTENIYDSNEKRMIWVKNTNCQKADRLKEELSAARDALFDAEQEEARALL